MCKIERSKAFEGFWEIRGKRRPRERGYGNLEKVEPGRRGAEKAKMAMGYGDGDNEEENRKEKEEKTPEQGETTRR